MGRMSSSLGIQSGGIAIPDEGGAVNITDFTVDRQVALGHGDHPALAWIDRRRDRQTLTYAQLSDSANRTARILLDLGIGPGDVVAVLLPKVPEFFFAALGAWKIGAVFTPLMASFGPGPIGARLEMGHAKVLITTPSLYAQRVAPHRSQLPELTSVLMVKTNGQEPWTGDVCLDFADLLTKADPARVPTAATTTASPAFLHFTSGTTGTPKGTLHGHGAAISHMLTAAQMFALTPDDVYWCTAEPGWAPCTAYGIIAPLSIGCLTIMDSQEFDAQRWYSILVEEKVTVWYTTPTSIRMMMRLGTALARSYRTFSLRLAASGGEPLNAEAVAWGQKALGTPFLDSWWQSETGAILIANQPGTIKPGSMGRPLPGVEIAIVNRTDDGIVPVKNDSEVGELAIKANLRSMFIGYADDPERYKNAFVDGWYMTGDHVRLDPDGFLWFVGRHDDLIKYQGQFIGPFEVENTLLDHPAVAETAVIGKPDPIPGHIPVAFVSLNPGFDPGESLRIELLEFAQKILGALAPKEIFFVENIPKTQTGCILRRALRGQM